MMMSKVSPALAAGCTIIVKTSEKTPVSALEACKLFQEAGFPKGVLNVLSGYGSSTGSALALHMDVDMIAFTGSTSVGHNIMSYCAQSNLKRFSLELGGKSPIIVFNDANLDQAVKVTNDGVFLHQGQICTPGSRIFVQSEIHDRFLEEILEMTKSKIIGSPLERSTEQGPLVDSIQFQKVLDYINYGISQGATLLCGGKRFGDIGFFVEPTIFINVTDDMKIAQEEIFGPVLSIMKFDSIEEVIQRANSTAYGLAAIICTRDPGVTLRVASEIKGGTMWVNW